MYRQGNGITGHYSLFLRKSRYSGSRACTDQQRPFSRSWECSFHTLSSPPFLSAFSSFSSFSFSLFFYFVLLAPFTTSNSIPMNRSEELEGRSWFNDDTPFRGWLRGNWRRGKKKGKTWNVGLWTLKQSLPFTFDMPWKTALRIVKFFLSTPPAKPREWINLEFGWLEVIFCSS